MSKIKALSQLLFSNLFLNCKALNKMWKQSVEHNTGSFFNFLQNKDLYPRLLSSIDFNNLPQSKKDEYLFKRLGNFSSLGLRDREIYGMEIGAFIQEAHNRTCKSLGVKPTEIKFVEFSKNNIGNGDGWAAYNVSNDEILLNVEKDYSIARPSLLLELINSCTFEHAVHHSLLTAMTDANQLSDDMFFLALMTATRLYVMEQMDYYNSNKELEQLQKDETFSPLFITQTLYSFMKTREDFQSAEIYGGAIQEGLRSNEVFFCNMLSEENVGESLISMEDLIEYFEGSDLNQISGGYLGKILTAAANATAPAFYNLLGADMQKGQTITGYIDSLEDELFDRMGVDKPTDEEALEYAEKNGMDDEDEEDYEDDEDSELEDEEDKFTEDDAKYRPMANILPDEGRVFDVPKLPFSERINPTQEGFAPEN